MQLMQYEVALPADYDMGIIRQRIKTRAFQTDDLAGLGLKAYAIRERGTADAARNEYAPFYFWVDAAAMGRFLGGQGFLGLCDSFGRPSVRQWIGLAFRAGRDAAGVPVAATRSFESLPVDQPLPDSFARAEEALQSAANGAGVYCSALAFDPTSWQLATYTLWTDTPTAGCGLVYQVLYVSAPGLQPLLDGSRS